MKQVVLLILVAFVAMGGGFGCAKKKGGDANVPLPEGDRGGGNPDTSGGGNGPGGGDLDDSETNLASTKAQLAQFFFQAPVNNPTNIKFAMSLSNDGGNGYGGEVRISFDDNGQHREAVLSSSHPHYTGVYDASLNVMSTWNGVHAWHGIFQDRYGAVVVVIDGSVSQGDGQASEMVSGSVWFQNFQSAVPPQGPMKMCWQITAGPYNCSTWLVGSGSSMRVDTYSSLFPTTSWPADNVNYARPAYRKLGNFSGLLRSEVFGE